MLIIIIIIIIIVIIIIIIFFFIIIIIQILSYGSVVGAYLESCQFRELFPGHSVGDSCREESAENEALYYHNYPYDPSQERAWNPVAIATAARARTKD